MNATCAFVAFLVLLGSLDGALAQDSDFLEGFAGHWSGGGAVRRKADEAVHRAQCTMVGVQEGQHLRLDGTCRVFAVISRAIGADITFDPASGSYSGTYWGSFAGPAHVTGKRRGDTVTLGVTWPQRVNGDTAATMRIDSFGAGGFTIIVTDSPTQGGDAVETTNLTFSRAG